MPRYRIVEDYGLPVTYHAERKYLFGWRRLRGYSMTVEGAEAIAIKDSRNFVVKELLLGDGK